MFLPVLIVKLILFIITVCSRACTCMCVYMPRRVWKSETVLGSGSSPSTAGPGCWAQVIRPDVCGASFTSRAALLVLYFNFSYLVELTLLSVSFVTWATVTRNEYVLEGLFYLKQNLTLIKTTFSWDVVAQK